VAQSRESTKQLRERRIVVDRHSNGNRFLRAVEDQHASQIADGFHNFSE